MEYLPYLESWSYWKQSKKSVRLTVSWSKANLLDVLNGVGRLDLQSDRLTRQGLDENLHIYLSIY